MGEIPHAVHQTPRNADLASMSKSKRVSLQPDFHGLKKDWKDTEQLRSLDFHLEVKEPTGRF